jgi:hypothetical protein
MWAVVTSGVTRRCRDVANRQRLAFGMLPRRTMFSAPLAAALLLLGGCGAQTRTARVAIHDPSCPSSDGHVQPSPDPRTAGVLVPAGPIGALVCRYWGRGDFGADWALAGARDVRASSRLNRLVRELDALRPVGLPVASCGVLGGRSVLILFHYPRASDDPVRILRDSCTFVGNGRVPVRYGDSLPSGEHWPDERLL